MYCSQCGKEIPGDAKFCPSCGVRQDMGVIASDNIRVEVRPKKKWKKQKAHRQGRRLGNFLVSVIALWILFAGNNKVPDASDHAFRRTNAAYFTVQNQREMAVCDEKGTVCTIDIPRKVLCSADQSSLAYIDRDGELYDLEDGEPVFVDDAVSDAQFSFYGDCIVYTRAGQDKRSELCIYTVRNSAKEQAAVTACSEFAVSPDGKTVAYVDAGGGSALYLWRPGREETRVAGSISEILSVADDGKMVVYRKKDGGLFCSLEDKEQKLMDADGAIEVVLNETQTEILYTGDGTAWYYGAEQKEEEPVRLSGVKGTVVTDCYRKDTAYQQRRGLILGRKTLKDMVFATYDRGNNGYRLYHLNWNGASADPVFHHADQFQISKDERSLLCLSGQKLYYMKDIRDSQDRICLSEEMTVSQFAADPELKKIWFVTSDRSLYDCQDQEYKNLSFADRMYGYYKKGVLFQEGTDLYLAKEGEKILVEENVTDVRLTSYDHAVLDTGGEFCYLKDFDHAVCLISSK